MTEKKDETLKQLNYVDQLCDRYETLLQTGLKLTPSDFLENEGAAAKNASADLHSELARLEAVYNRTTSSDVIKGDTEAFSVPTPKRVGRYELRRPLGSGGFGEVWVAFDPQLDREIAIKIPHKGILNDATSIERFYREAKAAAKLNHANIVRVHDAGSDGSTHFIAAEFIQGKTLRDMCSLDGMEIQEAVRIVADLASALFYAHRNQIVHRDIKPGNVLMDANNQPHLTDFGLASQLDASELTTNGTVLGTPIYMAPEQAAGRFGAALPTSDQYSLGSVLYELLTGRPPFSGTTSVVLYHKLNTAPPSPRSIRPEIPPEVEAICLRAMERIPEERFLDCEAMAVALRKWLGDKTTSKLSVLAPAGAFATLLTAAVVLFLFFWREPMTIPSGNPASPPNVDEIIGSQSLSVVSAQPPTPSDAQIINSTPYLPIHPDRPRKVVDFVEIHAATFSQVTKWLKSLGPDYCPSVIGEHAGEESGRYHSIAYRVNRPIPFRIDAAHSAGEDAKNLAEIDKNGYRILAYSERFHVPGPDGEFLRCSYSDNDHFWTTVGTNIDFASQMADIKERNYRPIMIVPENTFDGGQRLVSSIAAHNRRNWEAAENLDLEELKDFAEKSKAGKRFLFQIRAIKGPDGEPRFFAIALENSELVDWDVQPKMSTEEYEAELIRRKALGFRPTTVTSYGDSRTPTYAAAWIRYFHLPSR